MDSSRGTVVSTGEGPQLWLSGHLGMYRAGGSGASPKYGLCRGKCSACRATISTISCCSCPVPCHLQQEQNTIEETPESRQVSCSDSGTLPAEGAVPPTLCAEGRTSEKAKEQAKQSSQWNTDTQTQCTESLRKVCFKRIRSAGCNTLSRVLAWHKTDSCWTVGTPAPSGVILEHRARHWPCALLNVPPSQNKRVS